MYETIFVLSIIFFTLGYVIGRMRHDTEVMEKDIQHLESQRDHWRDVLKSANSQIDRINAARLQ